jgi:hypothetical protein
LLLVGFEDSIGIGTGISLHFARSEKRSGGLIGRPIFETAEI